MTEKDGQISTMLQSHVVVRCPPPPDDSAMQEGGCSVFSHAKQIELCCKLKMRLLLRLGVIARIYRVVWGWFVCACVYHSCVHFM